MARSRGPDGTERGEGRAKKGRKREDIPLGSSRRSEVTEQQEAEQSSSRSEVTEQQQEVGSRGDAGGRQLKLAERRSEAAEQQQDARIGRGRSGRPRAAGIQVPPPPSSLPLLSFFLSVSARCRVGGSPVGV